VGFFFHISRTASLTHQPIAPSCSAGSRAHFLWGHRNCWDACEKSYDANQVDRRASARDEKVILVALPSSIGSLSPFYRVAFFFDISGTVSLTHKLMVPSCSAGSRAHFLWGHRNSWDAWEKSYDANEVDRRASARDEKVILVALPSSIGSLSRRFIVSRLSSISLERFHSRISRWYRRVWPGLARNTDRGIAFAGTPVKKVTARIKLIEERRRAIKKLISYRFGPRSAHSLAV
jgi:hypothetical protein